MGSCDLVIATVVHLHLRLPTEISNKQRATLLVQYGVLRFGGIIVFLAFFRLFGSFDRDDLSYLGILEKATGAKGGENATLRRQLSGR